MNSDRWRRIKDLYSEARTRRGGERERFLAHACAGDVLLRDEVQELLDQPASTNNLLERFSGPEFAIVANAADEREPALIGLRIGIYDVQCLIGSGAMGDVYRAHDTKLDRDVALKMLPGALIADPDRRTRFEREARVLASLNHPNIAAIHGLDESRGPALVLELVEGETLKDRLGRGRMPVATVIRAARQIADALGAAHARGIVHRDLKLANIKITPDGLVKVLDFGIAKVLSDDGSGLDSVAPGTAASSDTRAGAIVGTAAYMSPEQARGEPVDRRADIWAFGCVLYEMLSGRAVFSRDSVADTLAAITSCEPDWTVLPASVPSSVRRLLRWCLEKDPSQRLGRIDEARAALATADSSLRVEYRRVAAIAVALLLLAAAALVFYSTTPSPPPTSVAEYTQITNFTDSAIAPHLSPDGRMVAFIRGGDGTDTFLSRGQIYVKRLPDGESVQLTDDNGVKYGPIFSPDGSRIAYTKLTSSRPLSYDTWTVPVGGGKPTLFMTNASGLLWIADRQMLFSEVKSNHVHMGIVTAAGSRAERREIYFPAHDHWMAHFSHLSPDRQSVLVVEMDQTHAFTQCRLVPFDGSSAGRQVGPRGECTAAAWSPDGKWMYFSVKVRGSSHLWRQQFPNGTPEQMTFGPTEEEGIAVAADGRTLLTSLVTRRSAIWTRDADGERPITSEGYARFPYLSRDATRLFYLLQQDSSSSAAELRVMHLPSGKTQAVLPGVSITDYDISGDEREVAFTTTDPKGESRIWMAPLDRTSPPREIARAGDQVSFGAENDLFFRSLEGLANVLVRIKKDGSGRRHVTTMPILGKYDVSPDGRWVIVRSNETEAITFAVSVNGGAPRRICIQNCPATWSPDGKFLYVARGLSATSPARTVAIPVRPGLGLPDLPASGIDLTARDVNVPGASVIQHDSIAPGPDPSIYVFTKTDLLANLYRIPLH